MMAVLAGLGILIMAIGQPTGCPYPNPQKVMIMNKDFGRTNINTQLICTNCGSALRLTYDKRVVTNGANYEITGGNKVDNYLYVYPCDHCYGKAKRPLELLKSALKEATGDDCG